MTKKKFITIYRCPQSQEITIEFGKIDCNKMMYDLSDNQEKEIGYPQLIKFFKLPKPMTYEEAEEQVKTDINFQDMMKGLKDAK